MTHQRMLVGTSLFSVLLLSLHFAQDAYHSRPGTVAAEVGNITAIVMIVVLLCLIALGVNGFFSLMLRVSELRRLRSERRMEA